MKRQIYQRLLVIVGIILLIGLIASCGGNEPRFKTIESREYTVATRVMVVAALRDKYMSGKSSLSNAKTIMEPYWNDVWPLIRTEMGKMSSSAAGMAVVIKVDTYKLLGYAYYESNGSRSIDYWLFNY